MLFGNPNVFAIEAELLEVYGKWKYGRLRFWIGGNMIGDWDDTSDLATSARWGRTFLTSSDRRTRVDLDNLSPADVYELLYGRFVEPVNSQSIKAWPGAWDRDPYIIDEVGESALRDRFAVLVVRKFDGIDRIIVNYFDEERLSETLAPPNICDHVIETYCTWVENQI
jgi:hypothetical protein